MWTKLSLFTLFFLPLFANIHREYDDQGNLIYKHSSKGEITFSYNDQHQLIKATTKDYEVVYTYDDLGRRISKAIQKTGKEEVEYYCYQGSNEIAIFDAEGKLKQLRIPGPTFHKDIVRPIAIEIEGILYAPILDAQCNIVKLINTQTKEEISYEQLNAFGSNLDELTPITPWVFSGKHYDAETGLVYFGHRY